MKKIISLFAIAAAVLVSCNEKNTDPDEPVQPEEPTVEVINPEGIVFLSIPEQVVAGDTVAIRLRVNPSSAQFNAENLSIDCIASRVYDAQYSEAEVKYLGSDAVTKSADAATRASYVQNTENYSIAGVVADTLNNESLEGQYLVLVKAQSEKNIIDCSNLALVYKYEDENGETACVSSETFVITQIPQPSDAIFAWSPQSLSLHAGAFTGDGQMTSDSVNAVKWYLLARTYKEASTGSVIQYDYAKYITDVNIQLEKESVEIACEQGKTDFDGVYSAGMTEMRYATPDVSQDPVKTIFEQGSDNKYEVFTNKLIVTDKYGHVGGWSQNLNYVIPTRLTFKLDVPEDVVKGTYSVVNKFETLAEYGIDAELVLRYPCLNLTSLSAQNSHGVGFYLFPGKREDGFGIGSITASPGSVDTIKADDMFKMLTNIFYAKGIGLASDAPLINFLNYFEDFTRAGE